MARHPFGPRGGRRDRTRNRLYIILGLLIIAVVIAVKYGSYPFGSNEDSTPEIRTDANVPDVNETGLFSVMEPRQEPMQEPRQEPKLEPAPEPNLPKIEVGPTVEPNPEAAKLINEATALLREKPSKIIEARETLKDVLLMPMSAQQRASVKDQLSKLAKIWLFSRASFPDDRLCGNLQVKSGDRLEIIGERFKVPYEIIMEINNISRPEALQAGDTIKIINGPFNLRIYRSTFTMDLYLQNTYVRSFPVGLGKPGKETPTGLWVVKPGGKLIKPTWYDKETGRTYHPEDPDYPLGSRWIGLEGLAGAAKGRTGFGIHGTKDPEEIGAAGSRGCIRLHNGDAILVYNLLVPTFSQVEVAE